MADNPVTTPMTGPTIAEPPWLEPHAAPNLPGSRELPDHADVVVIGAGIAGLAAAAFLAEGGARPVLVDAGTPGRGASGRNHGLVTLGLPEHPWRLLQALGGEQAAGLYRFCRENLDLLAEIAVDAPAAFQRTGGLWVAADAAEAEQIPRSADALRALGVPVDDWTAAQVAEALGTDAFGPGMRCPDEGAIDPAALGAALLARALRAGVAAHADCPVAAVTTDDRGAVVHVGDHTIVADAVVFAAGAGLPGLDPYFEERVFPFREQVLATAPVPPRFATVCRSQLGYQLWRQAADGRLVFSGARWASPHLEDGETAATVNPAVQAKIAGFLAQRFPDLADVPITHRWAWIDAKSCDGLPIIGPIPGSVRLIACAAFHGNEPGLGVRAGRAVADGLLTGRAQVPRSLTPGRFV